MKVFISHSHVDDALAYQVAETLKSAGFDVWDERQILPGENWAARVGDALEQSEAMVVLLTPAGLASQEVRSDIGYALGNKNYSGRVISVLSGPQDKASEEFHSVDTSPVSDDPIVGDTYDNRTRKAWGGSLKP